MVVIKIILSLIFGFFFTETVGYFFHRFLHSRKSGKLGKAHMAHHVKLYPPWDLYSEKYRHPGLDSTTLRFAVSGTVIGLILLAFTPFWFSIPVAFDLAVVGFINAYVHDSTHLKPTFLDRFQWFKKLQAMHMTHHLHVQKNFGILTFTMDKLLRSYAKPKTRKTISVFP